MLTRPVWTPGVADGGHFIAFRRLRVEEWKRARISIVLEAATGAGTWKVTAGARYANEEQTFAAASFVSFTTTRTGDGTSYATSYTDLVDDWQLVELGVEAANVIGGTSFVEMGLVTLIIDFQN